ncbi:hypothetical protein J5N97_020441 [Dioscorea zingiberensis]|uniref:Uncharacterized protein n=1 Tax=Dioscorea zingiberensis TaxID=325984 RepID=A0A9D5HDN5_9LILI|nr:hypothetical protein J5N97_020441 [Dioscorea zingiberensis]
MSYVELEVPSPVDPSVLTDQYNNRSKLVWIGEETKIYYVDHRGFEWDLTNESVNSKVKASGNIAPVWTGVLSISGQVQVLSYPEGRSKGVKMSFLFYARQRRLPLVWGLVTLTQWPT